MSAFPQTIPDAASPEIPTNENFSALDWAGCYAHDATVDSGLIRGYSGGTWGGFTVVDTTHTFGASTTTYVTAKISDGTFDFSTSNTNYNDTTNYKRIEVVVSGASALTSVANKRGGPGGVHGGGGGGGGGAVAGSDKQIQYNNSGAFGAEAGFEYDQSTNTLTVANLTTSGLQLTAASATGGAGFRLPHGAAPTSPVNGDVWTTSAGGLYARINGATVGPFSVGAGLANFTESYTNTGTKKTSSLAASHGADPNIDVNLFPIGTGGIYVGDVADGTTAGGDERGSFSTDFQFDRTASTQVASANYSGILCGYANTANALYAAVVSGKNNVASGQQSVIGGGEANFASGLYSAIPGGSGASTRGLRGVLSMASAVRSVAGDSQWSRYSLRLSTSGTTPAALSSATNAAPTSTTAIVLNNFGGIAFQALVTAISNSTGDIAGFRITGSIKRGSGVGTTAIVGTVTSTSLGADASMSGTAATAIANTTLGSLDIQVTGLSGSVHWNAVVDCCEIQL